MAHDLKSPFASILASLQVITRYERENFSEDGLSMMEGALSSGMNLVRMIDDLLNISRLQTGKIAMNKRFIDPHALVGRLIAARLGIAQQKGVGIINRIPSGTFLYCDPDLMGEVLQNLLTNAVKFTPKGGMVEIGMPKGDPAAIFVKDNGVGIPPGMLPNLFKHEEKTSTPGTEGERGTGLGLPLSFDIMRAHGGELSVVSAPAEGSTITARLPYVRPVVVAVDDDPTGRIFMAESLKKLGVSVFTASGADDAMLAMAKTEPHLLVTDIIMPEKDGFYLIDAVRKSRPRLPILAITADNEQGIRERVLDAGADDFVTKHAIGDDLNFRAMRLLLSH